MRITTLTLLVALLTSASLAGASVLESATGLHYQHDAGRDGDASDLCERPGPALAMRERATGTLVPGDDEKDAYAFEVTENHLGRPVTIEWAISNQYAPAGRQGPWTYVPVLTVLAPGCKEPLAVSRADSSSPVVRFIPQGVGTYVIQLTLEAGTAEAAAPILPSPLDPAPRSCHPWCLDGGAGSYALFIS